MKDFIIFLAALLIIFISAAYAQQYDYQSVNSHYNQYSPNNISSFHSQYESQFSTKNVSNPYSQYEINFSPKNLSNLPAQQEYDWHVGLVSGETKGKWSKKPKKSHEAVLISSFFANTKPKNNIPVFFYLLILSSLAVGVTIFVIIGIFKK